MKPIVISSLIFSNVIYIARCDIIKKIAMNGSDIVELIENVTIPIRGLEEKSRDAKIDAIALVNSLNSGAQAKQFNKLKNQEEINQLFADIRNALSRDDFSKVLELLGYLEVFAAECNNAEDEVSVDTDELVELIGLSDNEVMKNGKSQGDSQSQGYTSKKKKKRSSSSIPHDKQHVKYLNGLIEHMKKNQESEAAKLAKIRKGVETLLVALHGTNEQLDDVKKTNTNQSEVISQLQEQKEAASSLQKQILEIQEHAKINYETGIVEISSDNGQVERLTLDELSAKVHRVRGDENAGNVNIDDEIISRIADPAVLHADFRLLVDVVTLLGCATIGGMIMSLFAAPPLIGYILSGILVGPSGLNLIHTVVEVDTLAQFGSVFFMLAHGLENSISYDSEYLKIAAGSSLLTTGVVAICIQIYVVLAGITHTAFEAGLLGLSVSLSSLSLVLDYIRDHHQSGSEHGKIVLNMLTFQGLIMGFLFSLPSTLSTSMATYSGVFYAVIRSFVLVFGVVMLAAAMSRYGLRSVVNFLHERDSRVNELVLLGAVSFAMAMALLTEALGLSLDLGSYFAGIMLSDSPIQAKTGELIRPLAAVFASMLFASIGMLINPVFYWANVVEIVVVAAQVVIIKIVVITFIVRLFRFSWNTCLKCGLCLAHIGEFSLILSSKLQAHLLISRRSYLIFLAATATTICLGPLALRFIDMFSRSILRFFGIHEHTGRPKHQWNHRDKSDLEPLEDNEIEII